MRISDWSSDVCSSDLKRLPYADAAPGMAGAETLLALSLTLVRDEVISLPRLVAMLSSTPASLLGLPAGQLKVGGDADLVVFDPDAPWRVEDDKMQGQAGNTPFDGLPVQGKRSEEHTSELQSLMRISYAVFCLK